MALMQGRAGEGYVFIRQLDKFHRCFPHLSVYCKTFKQQLIYNSILNIVPFISHQIMVW